MIPLKSLNKQKPLINKTASMDKKSEITKHFSFKNLGEVKPVAKGFRKK